MINDEIRLRAMNALAEFKTKYPEYKIGVASIAGSHSFGWAGPTSDIDIRGTYIVPTEHFLGMKNPPETIEMKCEKENVEFQMHEIQKFTQLLVSPNLNMMDAIFTYPSLVLEKDEAVFNKLRELGELSLSKKCYPHVQGLTIHMRKHREKYNQYDPKKNLYIYREQLRGIHLFEHEALVNNISDLADLMPEYKSIIDMLLDKKYKKVELSQDELDLVKKTEREIELRMLTAKEFGIIRERPVDHLEKEAEKFLMDVRRKNLFVKR